MSKDLQLGIDTFGDVTSAADGSPLPYPDVIRNVVAEGVLADRVGLDFIGVGEHHRPDFAVSAPDMVLAALASATERIRLGTAVTVLSSDDPIRVFQRFATLDALSNGRAEVILGRGSFTESFPLFGHDLSQYDELFSEKLDLFTKLLDEGPVTWEGSTRPPLTDQRVYPTTAHGLTAWIAVGGSPESVVRAARYKLPLMLAVIGGSAARFAPYTQLFRQANEQFGHGVLPIGLHSPGHVAETDQQARDELREHWITSRNRIGSERGWPPARPGDFEREVEHGALYVGSPETVAQKIAGTVRLLGVDRFDLKYSNGRLPHEQMMSSIELLGTKVAPRVRELLTQDAAEVRA